MSWICNLKTPEQKGCSAHLRPLYKKLNIEKRSSITVKLPKSDIHCIRHVLHLRELKLLELTPLLIRLILPLLQNTNNTPCEFIFTKSNNIDVNLIAYLINQSFDTLHYCFSFNFFLENNLNPSIFEFTL